MHPIHVRFSFCLCHLAIYVMATETFPFWIYRYTIQFKSIRCEVDFDIQRSIFGLSPFVAQSTSIFLPPCHLARHTVIAGAFCKMFRSSDSLFIWFLVITTARYICMRSHSILFWNHPESCRYFMISRCNRVFSPT